MSLEEISADKQTYLPTASGINIKRFVGQLSFVNLDICYKSCSQGFFEPFVILVPWKYREFMAELTGWYFKFRNAQIVFANTTPKQADEIIFHSLAPDHPCVVLTVNGFTEL